MLNAVLADCSRIHDIQLTSCLDPRITLSHSHVKTYPVDDSINYMQEISRYAQGSDCVWIIAPESAGILESLVTRLGQDNKLVINCDAETIRVTGDKIKCATQLMQAGINTAVNLSLIEAEKYTQKIVIKSRFGVGCEGLKICDSGVLGLENIDDFNQWVLQPYIEGEHLSLSLLCYAGEARILTCNKQIFSNEVEPKLKACRVNALPIDAKMEKLVSKVAEAFPGLTGYIGVDLIQEGDNYVVIDINPRLTSSYAGLSRVLAENPAELCLRTIIDQKLPENIIRNNKVVEVFLE